MALPMMNTPTYSMVVPSTDANVKFRPFLVKEEKALLRYSKNIPTLCA